MKNKSDDQFCNYELSLLAKEAGFDDECLTYHFYNGSISDAIAAPLYQQLQNWFRDKHGIHIIIIPTVTSDWTFHTVNVTSERDNDVIIGLKDVSEIPPYKNVTGEDFSTHEEALIAALYKSFELIKK